MTNDIAIRDEMKAVERWENEGGKVSLNNLWASLKNLRTADNSRERHVIDVQKSPQQKPAVFSAFDVRRAV